MKPTGPFPCSQVPATCPYPEPEQYSLSPPSHFLKIYLNIILLFPLSCIFKTLENSLTFRLQSRIHTMPKLWYFLLTLTHTLYREAVIKPWDWSMQYAWARAEFLLVPLLSLIQYHSVYCTVVGRLSCVYILLVLVASQYIRTEYCRPMIYSS
jgi:hypothetical protein